MDLVEVDLTIDERQLLRTGLLDWGGPASPTDALARVIGFESVAELQVDKRRIADLIWTGEPLTQQDWTRALVATEIGWASATYGSGLDAQFSYPFNDAEAIQLLRSVQKKLLQARALSRPGLLQRQSDDLGRRAPRRAPTAADEGDRRA